MMPGDITGGSELLETSAGSFQRGAVFSPARSHAAVLVSNAPLLQPHYQPSLAFTPPAQEMKGRACGSGAARIISRWW